MTVGNETDENGEQNFNSHAHVERDDVTYEQVMRLGISTHTLTWSVTQALARRNYAACISTHTLTWSVTACSVAACYARYISTHTLTWSVTLDVVYIWCLLNVMRTYFFI